MSSPPHLAQMDAGARAAATALQRLLRRTCTLAPVQRGVSSTQLAHDSTLVVRFVCAGLVPAGFCIVVSGRHATRLAHLLVRQGVADLAVVRSALEECGNIAASAFLNGVAEITRTSLVPSVPQFFRGETRAVTSFIHDDALSVLVHISPDENAEVDDGASELLMVWHA